MNTSHVATQKSRVSQLAWHITSWPKTYIVLSVLCMVGLFSALPTLYKDTRADAFLAADNPALLYKNKVKAQFGLSDPIVIAVINEEESGVFNPQTLQLIQWLSEAVLALENVNSDRVTSLATENNITGSTEGMEVTPFFDVFNKSNSWTQEAADSVWQQVSNFPLYMGNMVAYDKQATLIIAELLDESNAEESYQQILAIVEQASKTQADKIYVAGEGAIAGYLGSYIDADAQRLNPLAGLIITLIILLAFRRLTPALLANVIIAASVLITLAIMALSDVAFFVITNALPVILIGISVADSMHIFSHYYDLQARQPTRDKRELIVETLEAMWRPITLTTLTTIAGFVGLYFAAYMPPFKYFGLFTAVGVATAWLYSLVFLPAAMAVIKPSASAHMHNLAQNNTPDRFAQLMTMLGDTTLNNSKTVVAVFVLIMSAGLGAALYLTVDEDRIETFHTSEPLYQADKAINTYLNGTNNLDIVIEATDVEGLFEPDNLNKMQALQDYALSLPNVQGATSIVDYLKQMNRSLTGGKKSQYTLPTDKNLIAQYFLIYSASSDPTDFEDEVDYDYRVANIRLRMNKGNYQRTKNTIEALENYIADNFTTDGLSATLSGRVTVNYHWINDLGESHFVGLFISLFLVWAVAALLFGSVIAGTYAIIPVASSILLVYAAMVLLNIPLGVGTSMFASVAIGLGVDFSIHSIDRLRSSFKAQQGDWNKALTDLYPLTGRALFFNYLAIALGFGVLTTSEVVPLTDFGTIVFISVTTSFFASMSLLPALINITKPRFISAGIKSTHAKGDNMNTSTKRFARITSTIAVVGLIGFSVISNMTQAQERLRNTSQGLSANEVVTKVNEVDDGEHLTRQLTMTMIDKRGKTRKRETSAYRKYYEGEKRTILFYKKPSNVKGTAFLTFDYKDTTKDDDQWLYLPAMRKVRRISASDRGDYFLGTDFTYEDIMLEGKLDMTDYDFSILKEDKLSLNNEAVYNAVHMLGIPKSNEIAKALGYSRTELWVDTATWLIVKADYWDNKGKHLKTLVMSDIRAVDGILTRHQLSIDNHKTGHHTTFLFSNVDYKTPVKDVLFTQRAMKQGQ